MMLFWLILRTLFSGIFILYLQVLIMPGIAIAGIIPNLFLGWLVYQVWTKSRQIVIPMAFFVGICFDLLTPEMLGLQALLFVLLAIGIDEFHKPLDKESFISILITIGLANLVYALAMYLVYGVQSGFGMSLLLSFLLMLCYNLISSVLVSSVYFFVSRLKLDFRNG